MEGIDRAIIVMGSISIGLLGLVLLKQAVPLHWRRLTLATTTWYAYALLLLVPSVLMALGEEPPGGYETLGLVLSAGVTLPIGVLIANAAWRFRRQEVEDFYTAPMAPVLPGQRKRLQILTGLMAFFSLLFFWETGIPPLVHAFLHAGEYDRLALLRQQVTNDLRSPFSFVYFIVRQFGWAFVLSCWLGVGWKEHWKPKHWLAFLAVGAFAVFYCSATLTRSPTLVLFLILFFFYYLFRGGQTPLAAVGMAAVLAFSVPILILFLHDPSRSWESIGIGLYQRIICAPAKLNFEYVKVFPEEIDFLYGRGIGKISTLVGLWDPGYEYFPISQEVYRRLFPGSPYRGNAPAPFVGMAYANWGLFGPALYGLLIGMVLQSIQVWLIRRGKDLWGLAAQAVLFYSFFEVNRTDFLATLFSYGGLLVPMGILLLQATWPREKPFRKGLLVWEHLCSKKASP